MTDVENEDKKVIDDEEREKILNKENAVQGDKKIEDVDTIEKIDKEKEIEKEKEAEGEGQKDGEVVKTGEVEKMKKQLEESQKESRLSSIRVPIGGIKIPGFLRSRSRDKTKEADGTAEEALDLLEAGGQKAEKTDKPEKPEGGGLRATLQRRIDTLAARSPFGKNKEAQASADDSNASAGDRPKLLDRLKIPAVSVLPKRFTRGNKDQKDGEVAAGGDEKKEPGSPDDGMESVKLDGDEGEKDPEKAGLSADIPPRPIYLVWLDRIRNLSRHEKAIAFGIILLLVLLTIIIAATSGGPMPTAPPVVDGKVITTTQCGPVEGKLNKTAFEFLGIPYAAPPTGERRWKPAQPLTALGLCWSDTLYRAINSSANRQCWQEVDDSGIDGFEDCLYLDIWTPEVRYINPVPVVVIIDSPTLLGHDSTPRLTPTSQIVHDREVVFVRPNFRLGVFGFLAATPLSGAVHPPSSGNYGLTDILVALKWVQTNIAHFGGDPEQVTLLGHRAGATLVTALTVSPMAQGLFTRAWATSGSSMFPGDELGISEQTNAAYVEDLCPIESNKDQLKCLLEMGAESLMDGIEESWRVRTKYLPKATEKNQTFHSWLVMDGNILREPVKTSLTNVWREPYTKEHHPHLVIGTTSQSEASASLREEVGDVTEAGIVKYVRDSAVGTDSLADEVLARYNSSWEGLVTMVTDIRTVCPLLALSRIQENITFYVATQPRTQADTTALADVSLDVSAILGQYAPNAPAQLAFVRSMQDLFYGYISSGALPALPTPSPTQSILTIAQKAEWRSDYPNCGFWIDKDYVPRYGRRD